MQQFLTCDEIAEAVDKLCKSSDTKCTCDLYLFGFSYLLVVKPYRVYQLILQKIVALQHEMHTLKKLSMSLILRASQLQKCSYSWGVMYCALK